MGITLYDIQKGGAFRVSTSLATLYNAANDHSSEVSSVSATSSQAAITVPATLDNPIDDSVGGTYSQTVTLTWNKLPNLSTSLDRKLRDAHFAGTELYASAIQKPEAVSATNEEVTFRFRVTSIDFLNFTVNQLKTGNSTFPIVAGTLEFDSANNQATPNI